MRLGDVVAYFALSSTHAILLSSISLINFIRPVYNFFHFSLLLFWFRHGQQHSGGTVNVGTSVGVIAEVRRRSGDDKSGEFVSHPVVQDWKAARYKVDYLSSVDARHFSAMFFDGHNKAMFDCRSSGRNRNKGA